MLKRIALLMALLLFAAGVDAGERKDTLVLGVSTEPSNLLPYKNGEIHAAIIEYMMFNTLISRADDGSFVGNAAKSWEYLQDDIIRFYLHDNITFSNGDLMTAEDVKFSLDKGNAASVSLFYNSLKEVRVVDKFTVDVQTLAPNVALFSNLAQPRSSIVNKAVMEKIGENAYSRAPIGTGPFKLAEWTAGSSVTLERREDFWGEKPAFKTLIYKFVNENASRSIELETGAVDIILEPDPTDLDRLRSLGMKVITSDSFIISQFHVSYGNLPDMKVRQALAFAVDTEALTEAIYGEMASTAYGLLPHKMFGYEDNNRFNYDVDMAKKLLAESSYKGEEIEVLLHNTNELKDVTEVLQYYWRQAGLNVKMTMLDIGAARAREGLGDYQIYVSTSNWITGDPSRPLSVYARVGTNRFQVPDEAQAKIFEFAEKGVTTLDSKERFAVYHDFQEFLLDHWITFPISQKKVAYVVSPKVENFNPVANGQLDFHKIIIYK